LKVLLDQNAPRGLRQVLTGHDVRTALQMGWDELENGDLIEAAERDGFDVMVTADQNIKYQQRLSHRRIALIVLETNKWPVVRASLGRVMHAVDSAVSGSYQAIPFDRPALRRRPVKPPPIEC